MYCLLRHSVIILSTWQSNLVLTIRQFNVKKAFEIFYNELEMDLDIRKSSKNFRAILLGHLKFLITSLDCQVFSWTFKIFRHNIQEGRASQFLLVSSTAYLFYLACLLLFLRRKTLPILPQFLKLIPSKYRSFVNPLWKWSNLKLIFPRRNSALLEDLQSVSLNKSFRKYC